MKTKTLSVIEQLKTVFIPTAQKKLFGHNAWLSDKFMEVYFRHARHRIEDLDTVLDTLDIAAISIKPKYQQQGRFRHLLIQVHFLNPWQATYVENVHNPFLAAWFERQPDWKQTDSNPFSKSFYQLTQHG